MWWEIQREERQKRSDLVNEGSRIKTPSERFKRAVLPKYFRHRLGEIDVRSLVRPQDPYGRVNRRECHGEGLKWMLKES